VTVLPVNPITGLLEPCTQILDVPAAGCVRFKG